MTKHKLKPRQPKLNASQMKVTVLFGYGLFILSLITFVLQTAPFAALLANPDVLHHNVIALLVVFVVSAFVPPVAGYLLGDRATYGKNRLLHHYNGVLFGIVAYWLAILLSIAGSAFPVSFDAPLIVQQVVRAWPVAATIIIMAIIAIAYVRKARKQTTLIQYRPFQLVLLAALIGSVFYSFFGTVMTLATETVSPMMMASMLVNVLVPAVTLAVSYVALSPLKEKGWSRLTEALVATSVLWIALTVTSGLWYHLWPSHTFDLSHFLSYLPGLLIWGSYLVLIRRRA